MEQGYYEIPLGGNINNHIRKVNLEGWQVRQVVIAFAGSSTHNTVYGLLLSR